MFASASAEAFTDVENLAGQHFATDADALSLIHDRFNHASMAGDRRNAGTTGHGGTGVVSDGKNRTQHGHGLDGYTDTPAPTTFESTIENAHDRQAQNLNGTHAGKYVQEGHDHAMSTINETHAELYNQFVTGGGVNQTENIADHVSGDVLTTAAPTSWGQHVTCQLSDGTVKEEGWKGAQAGANYCRQAECKTPGTVSTDGVATITNYGDDGTVIGANGYTVGGANTKNCGSHNGDGQDGHGGANHFECSHTTCNYGPREDRDDHLTSAVIAGDTTSLTPGADRIFVHHHHAEAKEDHTCRYNKAADECTCKCGGAVNAIWEPKCNGKGATDGCSALDTDTTINMPHLGCTDTQREVRNNNPDAVNNTSTENNPDGGHYNELTTGNTFYGEWSCYDCAAGEHSYLNACYKNSICTCDLGSVLCAAYVAPASCAATSTPVNNDYTR